MAPTNGNRQSSLTFVFPKTNHGAAVLLLCSQEGEREPERDASVRLTSALGITERTNALV